MTFLLILTQPNQDVKKENTWLSSLLQAKQAYDEEKFINANGLIHQSMISNPPNPMPAILHLKIANKMKNQEMLYNLGEIYIQQWPKCLQINVIKAIADIDRGNEAIAVERLHWVAANDSAGQVINRLMGPNHRFNSLWPEKMQIFFDLPIPASVGSYLGWNRLQSGQSYTPEFKQSTGISEKPSKESVPAGIGIPSIPQQKEAIHKKLRVKNNLPRKETSSYADEKDFEEIQKVFSKLAKRLKKPDLERADNRFPVYVILSSKKQLNAIYGPNTAEIIDGEIEKLVGLYTGFTRLGSHSFLPGRSRISWSIWSQTQGRL